MGKRDQPRVPAGSSKGGRWVEAQTGRSITLNVFRGEGKSGLLTDEQRAKFGRDHLLGKGLYVAPTKTLAAHFGDVKKMSVTLQNPYVIEEANGASLKGLDINSIRKAGHDGIVIKKGQWGMGSGQEDLKQAVVFPEKGAKVREGHVAPGGLDKGVKVKIAMVHGDKANTPSFRQQEKAAIGAIGKITSFDAWGNPNVKVGSKILRFNKDEVKIQ